MQAERLSVLLAHVHDRSAFYRTTLERAGLSDARSLRADASNLDVVLTRLPFTTKAELVADQEQHPPWGTVLTEPLAAYTRYHQTSGTTGRPLRWLDTPTTWQWALECWKAVYRGARVTSGDRVFFAFSFGPFFGFWTAFDAAAQLGVQCVPAGGMSTEQRLALIRAVAPTVVCCTPTYALRMAEVARDRNEPLADSSVRTLIVAGEPGGSIPATRQRIEEAWGAHVVDHHGLTEVGPVSFECWESPGGLHLNESEFVCEVVDPATLAPMADGKPGELVLTNLGRTASPVIRYRTGDLVVRRSEPCVCGRTLARLEGGILARVDDMVVVRGVNVYPAAIEAIVRQCSAVVEFRSTVTRTAAMQQLMLEIEAAAGTDAAHAATDVARQLREGLGLTVEVRTVAPGTLPRFEMKSKRFTVDDGA